LISASRRGSIDRRGSNLGGGGGSILPIRRSAACAPSAVAAAVDALIGACARIIAYGEGLLSTGTAADPIGTATLSRSSASQSIMTTVLTGVRGAGEEGEGGDGAGGASMVRAVITLRLGAVQLCRVSRDFSTSVAGGDFEATFASREPGPRKTTDFSVSTGPTRGVL
jgi:hypothetical protein